MVEIVAQDVIVHAWIATTRRRNSRIPLRPRPSTGPGTPSKRGGLKPPEGGFLSAGSRDFSANVVGAARSRCCWGYGAGLWVALVAWPGGSSPTFAGRSSIICLIDWMQRPHCASMPMWRKSSPIVRGGAPVVSAVRTVWSLITLQERMIIGVASR